MNNTNEKQQIKEVKSLINAYATFVKDIEVQAKQTSAIRAYGGIIRSGKGTLVERMAKRIVTLAWKSTGREPQRLSLEKNTIRIPIQSEYIEKIKSPDVKDYIKKNVGNFYYPLKTDVHVAIDGVFKLAIECKSYTENAMLKRILVDFTLLKQVYPHLTFALLQLESQLGGDYSRHNDITYGSPSMHTLLSYFDIDLNVITLLKGERNIDKPIHKPGHYKSLEMERLMEAIELFKKLLI